MNKDNFCWVITIKPCDHKNHDEESPNGCQKRDDLKFLSSLFNVNLSELETLWLANKLYDLVKNENNGLHALKVAEEQVVYKNTINEK